MRRSPRPGSLCGMHGGEPVEVIVQIGHNDGTVSGQVTAPGAPKAEFFGWLELMDRLERAVDRQEAMDSQSRVQTDAERGEQSK
jgi:hypothetical protein